MERRFRFLYLCIVLSGIIIFNSCSSCERRLAERKVVPIIMEYERKVAPLTKCIDLTLLEIAQGSPDYVYERLLDVYYDRSLYSSDPVVFAEVAELYNGGKIKDSYLKRQLSKIYYDRLFYQADSGLIYRTVFLEVELFKTVLNYTPEIHGTPVSNEKIESLLQKTTDSRLLKNAWDAQKAIGQIIRDSIINLVKCRNILAKQAGFKDYYHYKIASSGQNIDSIEKWFYILDTMTEKPYVIIKRQMDKILAKRYKINVSDLRPWHYQNSFFLEALNVYDMDQSRSYKKKNVVNMANCFFTGLSLDIKDIMDNSDLEKRKEKAPFSICIDIDRRGDVRLVSSLGSDLWSMNEVLRQASYVAYKKNMSTSLPYLLKDVSDPVLKEAVALLFRRFPSNVTWLQGMGITQLTMGDQITKASFLNLRAQQLLFNRWSQVMFHFEKELYNNPDQDLNDLWWQLVNKYQSIPYPKGRKEKADWATKVQLVINSCYYHNYLLGDVVASTLNAYICDEIIKDNNYWAPDYINHEEVGMFLKRDIFSYGDAYSWKEILKKATGKDFTLSDYYKHTVLAEGYEELMRGEARKMEKMKEKYQKK